MFCIHCGQKIADNAQCPCGFAGQLHAQPARRQITAIAIALKVVSPLIILASTALLFAKAIELTERRSQEPAAERLTQPRLQSTKDTSPTKREARLPSHSKYESPGAGETTGLPDQHTPVADPRIASSIRILAQAKQEIVIVGSGLGNQDPYDGNSRFIRVTDQTGNWNAGNSDDGAFVTLNVIEWSDSEIKILGFTGWYGDQWHLNVGDTVRVQIWNPQTGAGPATVTVIVQPGEVREKEGTDTRNDNSGSAYR